MYRCEQLERRLLLTARLTGGVLQIPDPTAGSFTPDTYVVTMTSTNITVSTAADGFTAVFPRSQVNRISIDAPDGDANESGAGGFAISISDPVSLSDPTKGIPTTINGSNNDDVIIVDANCTTVIRALAGSDTIRGSSGNDDIDGGDGRAGDTDAEIPAADDIIYGRAGNDFLKGGDSPSGNANLDPEAEAEWIVGDILMGQAGNDTLQGGEGRDLLDGGAGTDVVSYEEKGESNDVSIFFPVVDTPLVDPENPQDPEYDPTLDLAFDNYPKVGNGEDGEFDQFYSGLDTLGFGDDPAANAAEIIYGTGLLDMFSNGDFEVIFAGQGSDVVDVSLTTGVAWSILGNAGSDVISGSPLNDTIDGGEGADGVRGLGGNDVVRGGMGADFLRGDGFDPVAEVETTGSDTVYGGDGSTTLAANDGGDTLHGGLGADSLDGGTGDDLLIGDLGLGLADADPGSGNDTLVGGLAGTNGAGRDTLQGDGRFDTADYSARISAIRITFDNAQDDGESGEEDFVTESTEKVIGGSGNDTLTTVFDNISRHLVGGVGNDTLLAAAGSDTLDGGNGNDRLDGGTGGDLLIGGPQNDTLVYVTRTVGVNVTLNNAGDDGQPGEGDNVQTVETVFGGSAGDNINLSGTNQRVRIEGNTGNDTLAGGSSHDTLLGGEGDDVLSGNDLNDSLIGGNGNDFLSGNGHSDTLEGGAGADVLDGGDDPDTVNYSSSTTPVHVSLDGVSNDGTNSGAEGDNVAVNVETVFGGSASDRIVSNPTTDTRRFVGNGGNDTLAGGLGNDTLEGGVGDDSLIGSEGDNRLLAGDGTDRVRAGAGDDYIDGGEGNDSLAAGHGDNTVYGQTGHDTATGGNGADRLVAGPGNDSIYGSGGNDTLIGSAGSDTIVGGSGSDTASYYYERRNVSATLDGLPNDGVLFEFDTIGSGIENLEGGEGNDTLSGSNSANRLDGGDGNDLLLGQRGSDTLVGSDGSDTMNGGINNDTLIGGDGPDRYIGGKNTDTADYSARDDNLFISLDDLSNDGAAQEFDKLDNDLEIILGGSGRDSITGGSRAVTIVGGSGNDTLRGGSAGDSLHGGAGADSLFGNSGDDRITANDGTADVIDGGDGNDTLVEDVGLDSVSNVP
jgi:Ca2+-binding RTX toxin-like protein